MVPHYYIYFTLLHFYIVYTTLYSKRGKMPSTIAIAKNYLCFKLPFSEYSFSFPSVPFPWHTQSHTHAHTTATISEANTDTTIISEESPLLPHHHHHHHHLQQQQQNNTPQSLKDKYGTCTTILHYGNSSSVRLYTNTNTTTNTTTNTNTKRKIIHVIKTLRPTPFSTKQTLKSTLESLLSSTLYHPHLLHTIDIIPNSRGETCLVSEYCELGDLGTYISSSSASHGDSVMPVREADKILYQIMSAVEFLHEMGVVHGCVCVENVLIFSGDASGNGNGVCVKLGDLGDARVLDSQLSHDHVGVKDGGGDGGYCAAWKEDVYPLVRGLSMGIGKFEELEGRCDRRKRINPYAAPEVLHHPPSPSPYSSAYSSAYRRRGYGNPSLGVAGDDDPRAVDIWAVGIIYLVLRLGRILWRSASEEDGRYAEYLAGRKRREGYGVIEGLGGVRLSLFSTSCSCWWLGILGVVVLTCGVCVCDRHNAETWYTRC
ncbi:kinase-like protein [Aspergillus eucalypticola CBS 122712]|uniref:Kinase-like protein n=1 Tax=Aspergillus eucalypticola (strain CBS 122712 / IBT 29274) TaxID=1448314 RepID=A0A317V140_ASPEC|nr:kinase-like protein [Aspergillus eucalypticola CBS 122712]PWY67765.1 kinase-like protein [Aspergillus eucalypticola CBS 122712]